MFKVFLVIIEMEETQRLSAGNSLWDRETSV